MKTSKSMSRIMAATLGALGMVAAGGALAEQATASGVSPSAPARVDFSVTIPQFITFRVGSAGATIDTVTFSIADTAVGNGTDQAATANGALAVELRSNAGTIVVTPTNDNGLGTGLLNALSETLSYAQILTAATTGTAASGIDAPALSNAGGTAVSLAPTSGTKVNQRTDTWTYTYDNSVIPAPGTYTGRVTYTAALP